MGKSKFESRRALSAGEPSGQVSADWRSVISTAIGQSTMKYMLLFAAALSAPLLAAPGGSIDTLQIGDYFCELPGDVTGPVGTRMPAEDFSVINASSYVANGERGTYLLTGNVVTMTSGPKNGQRFRRKSSSFLRQLGPDGGDSALRCVRRTGNSG
jgi:hypothetical protein